MILSQRRGGGVSLPLSWMKIVLEVRTFIPEIRCPRGVIGAGAPPILPSQYTPPFIWNFFGGFFFGGGLFCNQRDGVTQKSIQIAGKASGRSGPKYSMPPGSRSLSRSGWRTSPGLSFELCFPDNGVRSQATLGLLRVSVFVTLTLTSVFVHRDLIGAFQSPTVH